MSDDDGLDQLDSGKLHDLAVARAKRHLDVRFFWNLIEVLPAAQASVGELREAEDDVDHLSAHIDDLTDSGRGATADALRPFYIEYLRKHGVRADAGEAGE